MSDSTNALNEAVSDRVGIPSLEQVAASIATASEGDLRGADRKALLAAVRRVSKWLNRDPSAICADMRWLNPCIDRIDLGYHRIARKTVLNARTHLVKAIAIHRTLVPRASRKRVLSAPWQNLNELVQTSSAAKPYYKRTLSSLISYGDSIGADPWSVDDSFFAGWRDNYLALSSSRDPMRKVRAARNTWNTCAAEIDGWPTITFAVPPRDQFWIPEEGMHPNLRREFAEYRRYLRAPRWFRKNIRADVRRHRRKRFAPATVENHVAALRSALAHIVAAGTPVSEIRSISDLVDAETVDDIVIPSMQARDSKRRERRAARPSFDETDGEELSYIHTSAKHLYTIALNWCAPPETDCEIFREVIADTEPHRSDGLTAKNLGRLRQFNTDANVFRLKLLPRALVDDVERERARRQGQGEVQPVTLRMVSTFQAALAVAILWKCPVRRSNLVAINTEVHLVRFTARNGPHAHLFWSAAETKTRKALEVELDAGLLSALELFCTHYLPVLSGKTSGHLFPCHSDLSKHMPPRAFAEKVTRVIHRWTGLRMNLHLFRHLIAKLLLDEDPTRLDMITQILGHKSNGTARRNYLENTTIHATRHFDGLILAGERAFLEANGGDVNRITWRIR